MAIKQALSAGRNPRICIVGAGAAGLRAADVLLQHGAHVTILEARDRLGGRLAQSDHLGRLVDLGPNWIHGTDNNPILELARETKTELHSWGENQAMFDDVGQPLATGEIAELQETFWDLVANAFRISHEKNDSIKASESLLDYFRREAQKKFSDKPAAVAQRKRDKLIQTAHMWGAFIGSPIERQSLKFFWLEECIEGSKPFVAGTYAKILSKIAQPATAKAEVRYGQEVTQLSNCDDHTVDVHVDGKHPEVFDEVIVTVPLGCLKANRPVFSPPLPTSLKNAIASIGYGCLDKVYITFPTAFWQTTNENTRQHEQGGTSNRPQSHSGLLETEDNGMNPSFTIWLSPTYAEATNPHHWQQECVNLAALPVATAHATLLFYIFGACSQHIAKLATSIPSREADEAILAFFEPYFSRLPNYTTDDLNCKPAAVLATAWANDKFAGHGSYSNFQVGLESGDAHIERMREGLPDRHIWIAGEHTAPFIALGTVTGAYLAGEEVANRIVQRYHGAFEA